MALIIKYNLMYNLLKFNILIIKIMCMKYLYLRYSLQAIVHKLISYCPIY